MVDKADFASRYGSWAIVAGASEGLGAAYADELASRGLNLVLVARRLELLQSFASQLSEKYQIQTKIIECTGETALCHSVPRQSCGEFCNAPFVTTQSGNPVHGTRSTGKIDRIRHG